jgi:hypothetical protein
MVFEIASTNLVIVRDHQRAPRLAPCRQFVGGPLMIALLAPLRRQAATGREARRG